jgi:hypothetical protein
MHKAFININGGHIMAQSAELNTMSASSAWEVKYIGIRHQSKQWEASTDEAAGTKPFA